MRRLAGGFGAKESVLGDGDLPQIQLSRQARLAGISDEGIRALVGREINLVSSEVDVLREVLAFAGFDEC